MQHQRHHATLFVDPAVSAPLEAMRRRWDPEMARQIAAHVTLVYPWEAPDSTLLAEWLRAAASGHGPFRLRAGVLNGDAPAARDGCAYTVEDIDGGHASLRAAIATPEFVIGDVRPHVTIVHPRTSRLGLEARTALRSVAVDVEFWVREIAITAWDGERWSTLEAIPLSG